MFPPRPGAPHPLSHRLLHLPEAGLSRFHVVWMHLEPETKLKRKTICLPMETFKAPPILCPSSSRSLQAAGAPAMAQTSLPPCLSVTVPVHPWPSLRVPAVGTFLE